MRAAAEDVATFAHNGRIFGIIPIVKIGRKTGGGQTSGGGGGEIPSRIEVGSRLYEIPLLFQISDRHMGSNAPAWGVLCPVQSDMPVAGLRTKHGTGTPRHSVQGIPRGCLGWYERHVANVYRQGRDCRLQMQDAARCGTCMRGNIRHVSLPK